jgi:hypothetical protein
MANTGPTEDGGKMEHSTTDKPEWFWLGFDPQNVAITFTMKSEVAKAISDQFHAMAMGRERGSDSPFGGQPFVLPGTEEFWGYEKAIRTIRNQDGNVTWSCKLYCPENAKKYRDPDWCECANIAASLHVLIAYVFGFGCDDKNMSAHVSDNVQVVDRLFMLIAPRPMHGFGLEPHISEHAKKKMEQMLAVSEDAVTHTRESVIFAFSKLYGERIIQREGFILEHCNASIISPSPKRICIMCPGDACDLAVDYQDYELNMGATFISHNVDSPIQQLSLFAGFARFCECIRNFNGK